MNSVTSYTVNKHNEDKISDDTLPSPLAGTSLTIAGIIVLTGIVYLLSKSVVNPTP